MDRPSSLLLAPASDNRDTAPVHAQRELLPVSRKPFSSKVLLLTLLVLAVAVYCCHMSPGSSWERFQRHRADPENLVQEYPLLGRGVFFLIYMSVATLALPITPALTMTGGFLFGRVQALLLVSFASTGGACLSFLLSRYLLRRVVEDRWGPQLAFIQHGVERDGAFFLVTLRLSPLVPFSLINLAMGLTRMRLTTFWGISQLAMLPVSFLFVNAGAELGQVEAAEDILSPGIFWTLSLVALVPLGARLTWRWRRQP